MFKLIAKIIYTVLVIIETSIAIRFVLTLIEADRSFSIVNMVYDFTDIFLTPFIGLVANVTYLWGFAFDTLALVGLVLYMILAFVLLELIKIFS